MEREQASRPSEAFLVTLRPTGLATTSDELPFSSDRERVEASLGAVLGVPERGEVTNCGAGRVETTQYPEGLVLNFQNQALVGWYYSGTGMAAALADGLHPGAPLSDLQAKQGYTPIQSTLDGEFTLGENIGGFVSDTNLTALYAGVNCFAR